MATYTSNVKQSQHTKGIAYYNEIQLHLNECTATTVENYINGEMLYLFTHLETSVGSPIVLKNSKGQNDSFVLLGFMDALNSIKHQAERRVYVCTSSIEDNDSVFLIDEQGIVSPDQEKLYIDIYRAHFSSISFQHDTTVPSPDLQSTHKKDLENRSDISSDEWVFSYANWVLTSKCLPMINNDTDEFMKQYDGVKVSYSGDAMHTGESCFSLQTDNGVVLLPKHCCKRKHDSDLSITDVIQNTSIQKSIELYYITQFNKIWFPFATICYIIFNDGLHGLAFVSMLEDQKANKNSIMNHYENGLFQLESPVCCFPKDDTARIEELLLKKHQYYWPTGYLAGNKNAKVYTIYYKHIFSFITNYATYNKEHSIPQLDLPNFNSFDSFLSLLLKPRVHFSAEEYVEMLRFSFAYSSICSYEIQRLELPEIPMEDIVHMNGVKHLDKYVLSLFNAVKDINKLRKVQTLRFQGLNKSQVAKKTGINIKKINELWGTEYKMTYIEEEFEDN